MIEIKIIMISRKARSNLLKIASVVSLSAVVIHVHFLTLYFVWLSFLPFPSFWLIVANHEFSVEYYDTRSDRTRAQFRKSWTIIGFTPLSGRLRLISVWRTNLTDVTQCHGIGICKWHIKSKQMVLKKIWSAKLRNVKAPQAAFH